MAGANYMGGRRNAARARISKSTERAQKRHFGSQRLNLAGNRVNLGKSGQNEVMPVSEYSKMSGIAKSVANIELAHVRQNSRETVNQNNGYIPAPIHIAPCTPKSKLKLSSLSEGGSSGSAGRKGHSIVLQALDTTEQLSLRCAMDSILSMPDLAGLSKCPSRTLKRGHSPCLREETSKRQRARSTVNDMDSHRHEVDSDFVEGSSEPHFAFGVTEDYSSDTNQSSTWKTYPKVEARPLSFSSSPMLPQPTLEVRHPISNMISGNLFDYEDPWTALGVMLGVENTPHTPLKKRDFQKVLAEIPTPASVGHYGRYVDDDLGVSNVHPSGPNDTLPTRLGLPFSTGDIDTSRNCGGIQPQISSPSVHSKPTLPNILHSLLSYSSGTSSGPPSSPTPKSQPHLDLIPGLPPIRGRQGSDQNTPPLVRSANSSPVVPENLSHFALSSPILHPISGTNVPAGHGWQDGPLLDADEEGDANIASDFHISPKAVHHRTGSISPGSCSSPCQKRQDQENFRGYPVSFSGLVAGSAFNGSMPYDSSALYCSSQEDVNTPQSQEEANSDSLSSPMRFALPSSRSDSVHDAFASLHSVNQENKTQILHNRQHSLANNDVHMPDDDDKHHNADIHALQLVVTPRPTTAASVPPLPSSAAADLLLSNANSCAKTSSSTMHASKPSQSEPSIAIPGTGARLQSAPQMKRSTELNTSLHAPSTVSLTPLTTGQKLQATNGMYRSTTSHSQLIPTAITTPQTATCIPRALPPSRSLVAMFSNSPSFRDHNNHTDEAARASAPTTTSQNRSHIQPENAILQKRRHLDRSDIQAITSRDVVSGHQQRAGAEVVTTKAENESERRARICLSLFADDEVESDSD